MDRGEVIIAGLGGRGVLIIGLALARAAMTKYKHVSWLPSYAISKRGGDCNCTVLFSNDEIASPLLLQAKVVLILETSQYQEYGDRVVPGGLLLTESAGLDGKPDRKDAEVILVPGMAEAVAMGNSLVANFIMLGAYIEATKVLSPQLVEVELDRIFGAKQTVLELNKKAFRRGQELVANRK